MLKWFQSYLNSRKQRIKIDGHLSDAFQFPYGVPRGSVLGPFLFISRLARRREIIICTMCVRTCVRECVTQFSLKLLQLHIFGKLLVLMNFYALQYFLGCVNLWHNFSQICCSSTFFVNCNIFKFHNCCSMYFTNISQSVRDRAISSKFLIHRVVQECPMQRGKISIFATFDGHLGF